MIYADFSELLGLLLFGVKSRTLCSQCLKYFQFISKSISPNSETAALCLRKTKSESVLFLSSWLQAANAVTLS